MFDTVCCILMYFFMYVKLYKFIRTYKSFFSIPNLFIFSINMHADIHAQADMSVLKNMGRNVRIEMSRAYMFWAEMTRNQIVVLQILCNQSI